MFAVDGWKLPNVVAQKAEKRRPAASSNEDGAVRPKRVKKGKESRAPAISTAAHATGDVKPKKDKSKFLPKYGKDKQSSTSNLVPVAAQRRKRTPTPEPEEPVAAKAKKQRFERPEKKPLARPPRSERDATPPKLLAAEAPPDVPKLGEGRQLTALQQKMAAKLSGARFRWINEKLYTSTGADALALISEQPEMFEAYHAGFREQVKDWPANPVEVYKTRLEALLKEKNRSIVVDLGCGEAKIAERVRQLDPKGKTVQIRSIDLLAANDRIEACDIAHLPLKDGSVDIAIFCLALMGTDFVRFLQEAHRVLKPGGSLWIAEIKSRFNDREGKAFVDTLAKLGFTLTHRDDKNKMFISMDFTRGKDKRLAEVEVSSKVGSLLKPCTYKKR